MGVVREGPERQEDRHLREARDRGWGLSKNFQGSIWGCRGPNLGLGTEGWIRDILAHRLYVEKKEGRTRLGALRTKTHGGQAHCLWSVMSGSPRGQAELWDRESGEDCTR